MVMERLWAWKLAWMGNSKMLGTLELRRIPAQAPSIGNWQYSQEEEVVWERQCERCERCERWWDLKFGADWQFEDVRNP
jgi:hypothetical protein